MIGWKVLNHIRVKKPTLSSTSADIVDELEDEDTCNTIIRETTSDSQMISYVKDGKSTNKDSSRKTVEAKNQGEEKEIMIPSGMTKSLIFRKKKQCVLESQAYEASTDAVCSLSKPSNEDNHLSKTTVACIYQSNERNKRVKRNFSLMFIAITLVAIICYCPIGEGVLLEGIFPDLWENLTSTESHVILWFIETQQAKQRDDRRIVRERDKEEWEIEKVRLENDLELKKLDNTRKLETEKQREEKEREGTDDMDAYLRRYERYAISQKWDKSIWATHLSALLKGNALNVYALLPSDQALNYDALKTCLLKRFNMTEDGFKQKFRSCRPESGETFQQFSVRLGSYFNRWIDMSNVLKTFDGLYDLMLRDQFLHICNNEVMLFLKERVPKSIDEMTRYADQFKEARRVNIVSFTNQTQKVKSQPPQKPSNIRKQEMPRVSDRDRNRHTGGCGGNRFNRKCFKCNKSDHLISNCPLLWNKVRSPMIPAECEKKPIKMPVAKGKLGDRVVTVLRDTGCNGVVIKKSLVSIDCFRDDYQTCILADGSSVKVPIAIITIDSPYYQGNIDGAREPYDPDISPLVSVVTRQQAKQRDNPYPKLKVSGIIKDVSLEDIEREQQSDESLVKLRQYVAEGRNFEKTNGTKVNYIVKKKLMYREFMSPKVENGKLFRQLIVPEAYRTDDMKLAHESLMAGHMATLRTVYRVLTEFYWPGVESDVKRYCRSCDICQRTVPKVPVTDEGNRYILALVDYATRYPEGVALPSIETERVAEALIDIFFRIGFPREILTDMGAQFTSNLMSEVSRLISLRQLTTTPYHPMCNGLVEKFNGTMKLVLKRLCAERPRDWD
ncbi:unnamed protein product [Mytilus coruscus]|uniref:Integrase catalytic domain-containing protein n=1 Tax=Mytilus coruscus TaxID=42192 RepID=A0A6J8E5Z4_MYTCO|nr:unnamed protein product [Mytilus coruscus]